MDDLVQILEEKEMQCSMCGKSAHFRSFILRDTKPYKVMTVRDCKGCGVTETTEDDYEVLDYGVRISCDFTKDGDSSADLRRMAFINSRAEVIFYTDDFGNGPLEILSFSIERGSVDCIEGLVMKGGELLSIGYGSKEDADVKSRRNILKEIMKGKGFRLVIVDDTGYSRVCPEGVEYTDVQDLTFDQLSKMDSQVLHEKTPKKEK